METSLDLLQRYGWLAFLAVYLLGNAGKIVEVVERIFAHLWPTWAAERQAALEREQRREEQRIADEQKRYVDTVMALKDMLLAYRNELDDSKLERRQLQNKLYEMVERGERVQSQVIEVLRDMSETLRAQTLRIDRLTAQLGEFIKENYGGE